MKRLRSFFALTGPGLAAALLSACDIGGFDNSVAGDFIPGDAVIAVPPPPEAKPPAPAEAGKLNVAAAFPSNNDQRIALVARITLQFDADLIQGQSLQGAVRLTLLDEEIAGTVVQTADDLLEFRPDSLLLPWQTYTVHLHEDLMSADGLTLADAAGRWQFTTVGDVFDTPQEVIDLCMSELDVEMLNEVNVARQKSRACGETLYPATRRLRWSCALQESAITHSQDMAEHDFFDHIGSDGSEVAQRVTRTGYRWRYVGENLAAGQRSVAEAMEGLLNSPSHCRNLMSDVYREFGSAYVYKAETFYKRYWTQNFATPF